MALFKSGNPALNEKTFEKSFSYVGAESMTVNGTLNKFGILFLMTMATAGLAVVSFFRRRGAFPPL